jgi:hypothetical protein
MKTQVIKLDSHDDVTSVRDKMSWAKAERILLVFPRHARILVRPLDLRLLRRHADTLGAQLGIVSGNPDQRRSAEELIIPAFARIASAQRKPWERENAPEKPVRRNEAPDLLKMRHAAFPSEAAWRSNLGLRFLFFTVAVLAILAVLSLFIPSATIILNLASGMQSLTLKVSASREVTTVNLAGSLPARVSSLIVEQSKTIPVTGKVAVPDAHAHGLATFRNLTNTLTGIPAGTVIRNLSSPPVRFVTTIDTVVAAGIDKKVDVPIQAVDGGTVGNLPAEALVSFEGELGTSLAVVNSTPTTGGSDLNALIQTASDRADLRAALLAEILVNCGTNIQQNLKHGDVYFPGTLDGSQVLSETFFPAADQSGNTLSLTLRVQCQAQYAAQSDLNTLSQISMDANLPKGYAPPSKDLTMSPTRTPFTGADGVTHWEMQVQRIVQASLDQLNVVELSAGRRPAEAIRQLKKSLALAESPVVQLKPAWWPWLPLIPFRITVSAGN